MNTNVFELLDLSRPGLEKVRDRYQYNDSESAAIELLAYMQQRTEPRYLQCWDNPEVDPNHDITEADKICNRNILKIDVGQDIDWKLAPVGDPEWSWCLNRHEYWNTLGRAYFHTKDEKYAREFISQLRDWIKKNPPLDVEWMISLPIEESQSTFEKSCSWRPLSAGIRMYTAWIPCFLHFLHSPHFTPKVLVTMLGSIADHAKYLRAFYTHHVFFHNVSPNWGIMESNGLAHIGIMFPEFKEATAWRSRALARLEDQIRCNIFPDGMLEELASGYHLTAAFSFLAVAELALRNNYSISKEYMRKLEKLIEFVMLIMKPHGVYPMLGDADESDVFGEFASYGWYEDLNNLNALSDINDLRYILKGGARLFDRSDMLWVATHGKEGKKPKAGSSVFPISGYFVMRSGWDHNDQYLIMDCGPLGEEAQGAGHGHCDSLSIDVSAYGQTLLIDPGRYIYTEDPLRYYLKGTASHNTIMVDGQDQSQMRDSWMFDTFANSTFHQTVTSKSFDYVDGSHDGYERLDNPVTHRRRIFYFKPGYWIVFDDLTGNGQHQFDLLYHFEPDCKVAIEDKTLIANAQYHDNVGLVMIPGNPDGLEILVAEGQEEPPRGWVSYDYAVKMPAPMLTYRKNGKAPANFTFVLQPWKDLAPKCEVSMLQPNVVKIKTETHTDMVVFADQTHGLPKDIECDGDVLALRFATDGSLKKCYAVQASRINYQNKVLFESDVKHQCFEKSF